MSRGTVDPLIDWRITANGQAVSVLKGERLHPDDFAYVPDAKEPSTWKLRIDDARHVAGAIAALGKGFRGSKVSIPADDLPGVKRKVLEAWRKYHKGEDPPEILKSVHNARRDDEEDDDDDDDEEDEDMTKNSDDYVGHSCNAVEASSQSDNHHEATTTAHEATMLAHKMPSNEAHVRAADEHHQAARKHDELATISPHNAHHHKKAAHHHRKAAKAHEDKTDMTTTHDRNPTHDATSVHNKKLHRMSDKELEDQHRELLAEKNRRDMNNFMGLTYHNPEEDTPSSIAGEAYTFEDPQDVDWDQELEGLGLSHNALEPVSNQAWFQQAPPEYQEALRESVTITNRERGALLQQLTCNMSEEHRSIAINRYKKLPLAELRQMVSMFAPVANSIGPPPIEPVFFGAAGGASFVGNQAMGQEAMVLPPETDWKAVAEANRGK